MKAYFNSKGFTLLEILIASAILSFALIAILQLQGNTMLTSRRAEVTTLAVMLLKQKAVEVELQVEKGIRKGEFPDEKSEEGEFEPPHDDFRWRYQMRRIELPVPVTEDEASLQARIGKQLSDEISKSVRELKIMVLWKEGEEEHQVDVVTHVVNPS